MSKKAKRYVIIFEGPDANYRQHKFGCLWCGREPLIGYKCLRTPLGEKHCGMFCEECTAEAEARKGRRNIYE